MKKGIVTSHLLAVILVVIGIVLGLTFLAKSQGVDIGTLITEGIPEPEAVCGDGNCESSKGEDFISCPSDCEMSLIFVNLVKDPESQFDFTSSSTEFENWINYPLIKENSVFKSPGKDCYEVGYDCEECVDYRDFVNAEDCSGCEICEEKYCQTCGECDVLTYDTSSGSTLIGSSIISGETAFSASDCYYCYETSTGTVCDQCSTSQTHPNDAIVNCRECSSCTVACESCFYCDEAESDEPDDTITYINADDCLDCWPCRKSGDEYVCDNCKDCTNANAPENIFMNYNYCQYCAEEDLEENKFLSCSECGNDWTEAFDSYNMCWECTSDSNTRQMCDTKSKPYICEQLFDCINSWNGEPCVIEASLPIDIGKQEQKIKLVNAIAEVFERCGDEKVFYDLPDGGQQYVCTMPTNLDVEPVSMSAFEQITYNGCGSHETAPDNKVYYYDFYPFGIPDPLNVKIIVSSVNKDDCSYNIDVCENQMVADNDDDKILNIYNKLIGLNTAEGSWKEVLPNFFDGQVTSSYSSIRTNIYHKTIDLDKINIGYARESKNTIANTIIMGLEDWSFLSSQNDNLIADMCEVFGFDEDKCTKEMIYSGASPISRIVIDHSQWQTFPVDYNKFYSDENANSNYVFSFPKKEINDIKIMFDRSFYNIPVDVEFTFSEPKPENCALAVCSSEGCVNTNNHGVITDYSFVVLDTIDLKIGRGDNTIKYTLTDCDTWKPKDLTIVPVNDDIYGSEPVVDVNDMEESEEYTITLPNQCKGKTSYHQYDGTEWKQFTEQEHTKLYVDKTFNLGTEKISKLKIVNADSTGCLISGSPVIRIRPYIKAVQLPDYNSADVNIKIDAYAKLETFTTSSGDSAKEAIITPFITVY